MSETRPKIKIKMTVSDKIIEIITALILIYLIAITFDNWGRLPEIIPSHFNFKGEIDAYSSKNSIFALLPITIIIYSILTILYRFPQIYNYVVEINNTNAQKQYKLAMNVILVLKLIIVMLFSFIQTNTILIALGKKTIIGMWLLPALFLTIFGILGIYTYKSLKIR